jgi:hypothetical protein
MDKYTQVLMTYLTRKWVALYAVGSLIVLLVVAVVDGFKSSPKPFSPASLFYVFPIQFLGMHLKQQVASPQANLVPGYRRPHLTIALLWLTGPLVLVAFGAWVRDSSVIGTIAVVFYVWLTVFYVSVWPHRIALAAYAFGFMTIFIPHLRAVMFDIVLGREPLLTWSLFSAEAAAVVLLFHHLATLTEDDREYGNVTAMNPWDLRPATIRKQHRAAMLKPGRFRETLYASASRRLDRITKTPAKTFWQRVALYRMSEDWPTNWWFAIALIACIEIFVVKQALAQILTEQEFRQATMIPLTVSTWLSLGIWFTAYRRWGRLGYESLRPATRRQWVWENAVAMLMKLGQVQILWLLIQGCVLFIYFPEFRTSRVLPEAFACWLGWQTLIFGVSAWIASFGSFGLKMSIMGAMLGLMSMAWVLSRLLDEQQSRELWLVTGITTGAIGLGMCVVAYRRWCRIDFD